jgi:hypothetical protein
MPAAASRSRIGIPLSAVRCLLTAVLLLCTLQAARCQSVSLDFPAVVNFDVSDVGRASSGSPDPFTLRFSSAMLGAGSSLRISVKANAANFTPPSGAAIPSANLSWTIQSATGGAGSPGTLSAASYSVVYLSTANPVSGSVGMRWSLAAPGAGIRAGLHTLTMTWKVEAL